jgi:hypothetical protein
LTPAPPNSKRAARDRLLVLGFLAALGAPWVDQIVRTDEARGPLQREHRLPGAQPEFSLDPVALYKFPAAYESYFKDTFGLRDVLLRWHTRQSLELFDTSPTTQVLLGKDGWYFYTGNDSVRALRGLIPFSEDELESWKTGLEARRDWLRAQGIDYLFVIAPNKETVYPDYLPDSLTQIGPTRFDQLADYMKRNSDLEFLDMRAAFAAARPEDKPSSHLYLEEGTHWNARGVLVAYREILDRLARFDPALAPLPPEQWVQVPFDTSGDTWASNMYIGDLSRQREVGLMRPVGTARSLPLNAGLEGPFGPGRKYLRGTKDDSQPRVLMFHDSFGPFLENMLSENCSTLECEWTYEFDSTEVLSFRPRVVLELWVERALVFRDPRTLAPRATLTAEASFAHAPTVLLRVDPTRPADLELLGQMKVSGASDERGPYLCVQPVNDADTLLLPPLSGKSQGLPLLHISIDSPRAGALDILYLREGETQYIRQHNCPVALQKGANDLYLRMPDARIAGKLRLRPRFAPEGPYLLRGFEVRSGPNP